MEAVISINNMNETVRYSLLLYLLDENNFCKMWYFNESARF